MTTVVSDSDRDAMLARLRDCTILLVDDEQANLDLLEAVLAEAGFVSLVRVDDARDVMTTAARVRPDLILLDLHMPHRHGLEVLHDLRVATPADEYLPILVLTADATADAKERALRAGARDFLTKPFDTVEVILRVENLLETRTLHGAQRAARQRAEYAERRAALLAEWSRRLALSLDATTALSQLPSLVVPAWCDGCVVVGGDPDAPILGELQTDGNAVDHAAIIALSERLGDAGAELQLSGGGFAIAEPVRRGASATNPNGNFAALVFLRDNRPFTADERAQASELARRAGLAAERARLFAAAELATRERERLLAVVAHDLRNPLGVVAMYAEMLTSLQPDTPGASPTSAHTEYTNAALSTIHRTTQGMQSLVEDLLDATTLRDGAFKLHIAEHDPRDLLARLVELLSPLAQARGMRLDVQSPQSPDQPRVRADATRLSQVLSNLVGNAIKFSPPGATIVLRWSPTPDALDVEVIDQGDGIASDELPHLFTAFWQGKKHNMRGAGLGLWIARAIVEGHGGTIAAASTPGGGATFRVTLPYEATIRRWED